MTRSYAARRLLEHGPLTHAEFVSITGWPCKITSNVLRKLWSDEVVAIVRIDGVRHYALAA